MILEDLMPKLKSVPLIKRLRKAYPDYTWKYNPHGHMWECEVGYVTYVANLGGYNGDDYCGSSLCFYRNDGESTTELFL